MSLEVRTDDDGVNSSCNVDMRDSYVISAGCGYCLEHGLRNCLERVVVCLGGAVYNALLF